MARLDGGLVKMYLTSSLSTPVYPRALTVEELCEETQIVRFVEQGVQYFKRGGKQPGMRFFSWGCIPVREAPHPPRAGTLARKV